jgi:hypothetical protein
MRSTLQRDIVLLALNTPELRTKILESLSVLASPEFVPHEYWHKTSWLLPLEQQGEPWFYCAKENLYRKSSKTLSNSLWDTIDLPLRELVLWMTYIEVETGPSCAGHQVSKQGFFEVWSNLQEEKERIRKKGLLLKDVETGNLYVMRDSSYGLPWGSFNEFYIKATEHQPKGWLPFKSSRWDSLLGDYGIFQIKKISDNWRAIQVPNGNPESWTLVHAWLRKK